MPLSAFRKFVTLQFGLGYEYLQFSGGVNSSKFTEPVGQWQLQYLKDASGKMPCIGGGDGELE